MKPNDSGVEKLSEQIHHNYCDYVLARTGKPYWTGGDYTKLDEATKEADRIQVKWMLEIIHQAVNKAVSEAELESDSLEERLTEVYGVLDKDGERQLCCCNYDMKDDVCGVHARYLKKMVNKAGRPLRGDFPA